MIPLSRLYIGGLIVSLILGISACCTNRWFGIGSLGGKLMDLNKTDAGRAVIAMTIMGVMVLAFALILEIVMILINNATVRIAGALCCVFAAIFLLIALIVYGEQTSGIGGVSLWLLSACCILTIESAVIGVLIAAKLVS